MSDKKQLFQDYLIDRFGYIKDQFLQKYLQVKTQVLDSLTAEQNIWKYKKFTYKNTSNKISATDISSYKYCPVAYAIQKTFETPKQESSIIGTELHNERRLLNYLQPFNTYQYKKLDTGLLSMEVETIEHPPYIFNFHNDDAKEFIEYLKNSIVLFTGHTNNNEKATYFTSKKGNFVAQPDYIFRNKNDATDFAVEEKFVYGGNYYYTKEVFFKESHRNQLRSYLYSISEYDLKFGYLVYWVYNIDNGQKIISECRVLKITKSEYERNTLIEAYINLKLAIKQSGGVFDINKRNANKCANCVVSNYCTHKTGRYTNFTIPYSLDFYNLNKVEFPNELIKLNTFDTIRELNGDNKLFKAKLSKSLSSIKFYTAKYGYNYDRTKLKELECSWVLKQNTLYLSYLKISTTDSTVNVEEGNYNDAENAIEIATWITGKFDGYLKGEQSVTNAETYIYYKAELNFVNGILTSLEVDKSISIER
jgi:hypothetical protein